MPSETPHTITRFLGTDDSVTTCDCCGKSRLKHTVALETDEGHEVFYGVTCAARALKLATKEVKQRAQTAEADRREAKRAAEWQAHHEEEERFEAWLKTLSECILDWDGRVNRIKTITALGGWDKTKEAFLASKETK